MNSRTGRNRAVFLDRDGVINVKLEEHRYVTDWSEFRFIDGIDLLIGRLRDKGYKVFITTNQQCVGKGIISRAKLDEIHDKMLKGLEVRGAHVEGLYVCPHRHEEGCSCRKPKPGLLLQAAKENGIELSKSYMVGDSETDIVAAVSAGCIPVLYSQDKELGERLAASHKVIWHNNFEQISEFIK